MNITLFRVKPLVLELRGIRSALERLADCWETELADQGLSVRPSKPDKGPEPSISYTNEEEDWAREEIDYIRREEERLVREENEANQSGFTSNT